MSIANDYFSIAALDLEPMKMKLMQEKSGRGWSRHRVDAVEREYRRFLYLVKKFPNQQVAPRFDVDLFWHQHILDTRKYAIDCQRIFGYFLHHYPYLGLRGEDDMTAREQAGQLMRTLYEQVFGESYDTELSVLPPDRISDKTAFCTVTAEPAFCTITAGPATFAARAEPAFCTVTAEPAFCTVTTELAFCTVPAGTAFCTITAAPVLREHRQDSLSLLPT